MIVMGYGSDVVGYDRRRTELSNAPLHMNQDASSIDTRQTYLQVIERGFAIFVRLGRCAHSILVNEDLSACFGVVVCHDITPRVSKIK